LASGTEAVTTTEPCQSTDTRLCVRDGRFEVEVWWQDFDRSSGAGKLASLAAGDQGPYPALSSDSALFWFFAPDNWEMQVKVLDGCALTGSFWVYSAATTNVRYSLTVRDTWTGDVFQRENPLGVAAPALTETSALPGCAAPPPDVPLCVPGEATVCLGEDRFEVEIEWADFRGRSGHGRLVHLPGEVAGGSSVHLESTDSGVFQFFGEENWELLVKVLDGCATNDRFWVFSAATTNVAYTLSVTDRWTARTWEVRNPLGVSARATTDTEAFDTCGLSPPETAELRLVSARDHIEGNFLTGSAVFADEDYIYLASYLGDLFVLARDRSRDFPLLDTMHLSERPLRAVRGDGRRILVTGDDAVIRLLVKSGEDSRPLEAVLSIELEDLGIHPSFPQGLLHMDLVEPWLYLSSINVGLAVNRDHVFLTTNPLNPPGIDFAFKILAESLDSAVLFDSELSREVTAVYDRHTGEIVGSIEGLSGTELYADGAIVAQMQPGCCGEGVFLASPETLESESPFPILASGNANAAVRRGPWLIVGDEYGSVNAFDLRRQPPLLISNLPLRVLTGHLSSEAIEIRALWTDRHDNLIFAGSSWGNPSNRGPDLPSFFVIELVEHGGAAAGPNRGDRLERTSGQVNGHGR
jgi:hypothetical protein